MAPPGTSIEDALILLEIKSNERPYFCSVSSETSIDISLGFLPNLVCVMLGRSLTSSRMPSAILSKLASSTLP